MIVSPVVRLFAPLLALSLAAGLAAEPPRPDMPRADQAGADRAGPDRAGAETPPIACRDELRPSPGEGAEELRTSRDLYCMELLPAPAAEDASGLVELRRVPSPFGTTVTPAGSQLYDLVLDLEGLPDPASVGDYSTYVAWAATPLLHPVVRLGEVGNGRHAAGRVGFDKFIILVSAETSAEVEERTGPLVLRGQSPSTRMAPADMLDYGIGAALLERPGRPGPGRRAEPRPGRRPEPGAHHGHGEPSPPAAPGARWIHPPMPPGITMLPAMMQLGPPDVTPYLPAPAHPEAVPEVRPTEIIRLGDGDSLRLEAGYVRRSLGGRSLVLLGFNGQIPGPLLWVQQDAEIEVTFMNRTEWPATIHWHGVRLDNRFDGVPGVTQEPVAPGEAFRYRVRFPDAGIYWYHPHHREDVLQALGLYGNMMVRPDRPDYFGPVHREEILVLDDLLVGEEGLVPFGLEEPTHVLMGRFGNVLLVNGEPGWEDGAPGWELEARRGEVIRLFLTNVSSTRTYNVSFVRGGASEGPGDLAAHARAAEDAPLKAVGTDVGQLEREERVESVVIAPAERSIVHVRFPEPGRYHLVNRVRAIDHVGGRFLPQVDTLGTVTVSERPAEPDLSAEFETLRDHRFVRREIDGFRGHFERPPDRRLVLEMEARGLPLTVERLMQLDSAYFHPVEWSGTMPMMNWISTGREVRWVLRDPDTGRENEEIDWRFREGEVVKLRIANRRDVLHAMQHPIHLHGQRFLVLEQDGVPNDNLGWKDTALVPVGSTVDLLVEMSNPGRWMLHCHIAEHLDVGMRMVFTVEAATGASAHGDDGTRAH